jgi:hypothetical protein
MSLCAVRGHGDGKVLLQGWYLCTEAQCNVPEEHKKSLPYDVQSYGYYNILRSATSHLSDKLLYNLDKFNSGTVHEGPEGK